MISKSVPDRLPSFSFRRLVHKAAPVAICALGVLWLGSFFAAAPQPQGGPPPTTRQAGKLELHHPVERDMGPGKADLFTVDAAAGQFLRVVADQKGVDVLLRIVDPEGKVLVTADRPGAFGPESASAIVPRSGSLQVKVEMAPNTFGAGQYTIDLTDLRDPTERDRMRIDAESKLFAAIGEGRAADPTIRRRAIEHYIEVASLWRDLPDGFEQALCLHSIGVLYSNQGEYQKALDYYQQALPIRHGLGDKSGEGATLGNMGSEYGNLGERQKALDYAQQALALDRSVGNRTNEASVLSTIGKVYSDLGEEQNAIDSYMQALSLCRATGNRTLERPILYGLSLLHRLPVVSMPDASPGQPTSRPSPADTQFQLMAQAGQRFAITAIAFSPDGRLVLTTSQESTAILWSVDEGKEIRRFEGHNDVVTCGAFLPDGNRVATGSRDKTVRIWDIHTGQELQRLTDSMAIGAISLSSKGDMIATAGERNQRSCRWRRKRVPKWRRSGPLPGEPFGVSLSLFSEVLSGTARSGQGRAVVGRGEANLGRGGRFWEERERGKGGGKDWRKVARLFGPLARRL